MKYTFGKTKACASLEQLVENNPWASRRVSRLLSNYSNQLLHITGARDPETVKACMELLKQFTLKRVDSTKLDPTIKSHLKNIVCYRCRQYRGTFEAMLPFIEDAEARAKAKAEAEKGLTSGEEDV
jgi:hypothetical protein